MPSQTRPRWVQTHPTAVTGGPDTSLLAHANVREAAPGCIHPFLPLLLTPAGGSLCRSEMRYLFPSSLLRYQVEVIVADFFRLSTLFSKIFKYFLIISDSKMIISQCIQGRLL